VQTADREEVARDDEGQVEDIGRTECAHHGEAIVDLCRCRGKGDHHQQDVDHGQDETEGEAAQDVGLAVETPLPREEHFPNVVDLEHDDSPFR